MIGRYYVWDMKSTFGDVVIATFHFESDAILFAKAKAKREGGFATTIVVGTNIFDRKPVPVD